MEHERSFGLINHERFFMTRTLNFRRMSLCDPNSFRNLEVLVPNDLSELANETRAELGEEEQLEANSHPDLPTSFDIAELPSHWDFKPRRTRVERMNLKPLPNETSFNPAVPANQFCPIPDLNEPSAGQEDNARASGIATNGFVPSTLQKGEQFLRQAFSTSEILRTRNPIRWANSSSAFSRSFAKDANLFG
jgi:hypothetical protein